MLTFSLLGLAAGLTSLYLYRTRSLDGRVRWSDHRSTFLNLAFVFALGGVSLAFEYESAGRVSAKASAVHVPPEIDIEVVRTAAPRPATPPPPPPPAAPTFQSDADIVAVSDEVPLEEVHVPELPPAPSATSRPAAPAPPAPPPPPPPAPETPVVDEIFKVVEEMPRFPGCEQTDLPHAELEACSTRRLLEFVGDNFGVPAIARENGVEGTAVVRFVVERDGSISDVQVVRDPGAGIGREAERVIAAMPRWLPGRQRGEPVRVYFNLPVKVRLE